MDTSYHKVEQQVVPVGEERTALREQLLGENAQKMLEFQNRAVQKFGPAAGIFIRQLVFWDGERSDAGDGWMWKSRREMQRETGLNQRYQKEARDVLIPAGVLEEEVRPVGHIRRKTLHYRPDLNGLLDLLYPVQEAVSGTGYEAEVASAAYLSEETPVEAVSSTGYEVDENLSAYLSAKSPVEAESAIQESTAGEDLQVKKGSSLRSSHKESETDDDFLEEDYFEDVEDMLDSLNAEEEEPRSGAGREAAATSSRGALPTQPEEQAPRDGVEDLPRVGATRKLESRTLGLFGDLEGDAAREAEEAELLKNYLQNNPTDILESF